MTQQTQRLLELLKTNSSTDKNIKEALDILRTCLYLEEVMHTSKHCSLKVHHVWKLMKVIPSAEFTQLLDGMPFMKGIKEDIVNQPILNVVNIDGTLYDYQPNATISDEL